jgi:hypothetical protein
MKSTGIEGDRGLAVLLEETLAQKVKLIDELSALREENDLQRQSIQDLSAQVVALSEVLNQTERYMTEKGVSHEYAIMKNIRKVLATPDPGVDIKGVVEAAKDICGKCETECHEEGWDTNCEVGQHCDFIPVKMALSALKGGER